VPHYQRIMSLPPVFPLRARRRVGSLLDLSLKSTSILLARFIAGPCSGNLKKVAKIRRFVRKMLPASLITAILKGLIPGQEPGDKWNFPCVEAEDRLYCKVHWQCDLVQNKLPEILSVLFSEDISDLKMSLKRVKVELYPEVVNTLTWVMTKAPVRPFPNLVSLALAGGTVHSDNLLPKIEKFCFLLRGSTTRLEHLHLPIASNIVANAVSKFPKLRAFRADRTKKFNNRGLLHLCEPGTASKKGLEVLVLGVYRHANFEKQHVASFLGEMEKLKELSLLDSDRSLVRLTGNPSPGDKVLVYSAFKRAILDREHASPRKKAKGGEGEVIVIDDTDDESLPRKARSEGGEVIVINEDEEMPEKSVPPLTTDLREINVVDRCLKPHYLLEHAPRLRRLAINWQQELCLPPFNRYQPNWFTNMIKGNSWASLSRSLTRLDITFPAAHTINSYCLPLEDFTKLMQNLPILQELRLVGAGGGGPIPLIPILFYCPRLKDLVLEQSPVHVPDNYEVISTAHISHTLTRFYYLGEMSSLLVHDFMMRGIAAYMPALRELEVQPKTVMGYVGLRPDQMRELACLQYLERLSLPLSIKECISNLPEVIFVLRDFPSLRHLTLSWGMVCDSYDVSKSKVATMMAWLFNALQAENASVSLQLCYKQHKQEFMNPCHPTSQLF